VTYTTVTVKSGDSLWNLADQRTARGGDIQSTVDTIIAANHLSTAAIAPGQHLRIPE
jgi:LysM repeat protein